MRISNTMSQPRDNEDDVYLLFLFLFCVFAVCVFNIKGQYLKYVGMQSLAIKYNDDVLFITLLSCFGLFVLWIVLGANINPNLPSSRSPVYFFLFYFMLTFFKKNICKIMLF